MSCNESMVFRAAAGTAPHLSYAAAINSAASAGEQIANANSLDGDMSSKDGSSISRSKSNSSISSSTSSSGSSTVSRGSCSDDSVDRDAETSIIEKPSILKDFYESSKNESINHKTKPNIRDFSSKVGNGSFKDTIIMQQWGRQKEMFSKETSQQSALSRFGAAPKEKLDNSETIRKEKDDARIKVLTEQMTRKRKWTPVGQPKQSEAHAIMDSNEVRKALMEEWEERRRLWKSGERLKRPSPVTVTVPEKSGKEKGNSDGNATAAPKEAISSAKSAGGSKLSGSLAQSTSSTASEKESKIKALMQEWEEKKRLWKSGQKNKITSPEAKIGFQACSSLIAKAGEKGGVSSAVTVCGIAQGGEGCEGLVTSPAASAIGEKKEKRLLDESNSQILPGKVLPADKPQQPVSAPVQTAKCDDGKDKLSKHPLEKPKQPLTAYNLFFQHERKVILGPEFVKQQEMDAINKSDGSKKRRPHRKTHGKIGFVEMSRAISSKWKQLDEATRRTFKDQARALKLNHDKEMAAWKVATQRLQHQEQPQQQLQQGQQQPLKEQVESEIEEQQTPHHVQVQVQVQLQLPQKKQEQQQQELIPQTSVRTEQGELKRLVGNHAAKSDFPTQDGGLQQPNPEQTKPTLPDKPKRPLSAYNIFFQHQRRAILGPDCDQVDRRQTQGKVEFVEMVRFISAKWKQLDESTRSRFLALAEKEKTRYKKEFEVWKKISQEVIQRQKQEQNQQQNRADDQPQQEHSSQQQQQQQEVLEGVRKVDNKQQLAALCANPTHKNLGDGGIADGEKVRIANVHYEPPCSLEHNKESLYLKDRALNNVKMDHTDELSGNCGFKRLEEEQPTLQFRGVKHLRDGTHIGQSKAGLANQAYAPRKQKELKPASLPMVAGSLGTPDAAMCKAENSDSNHEKMKKQLSKHQQTRLEKPKQPLTAYNLFFQYQRKVLLGPEYVKQQEMEAKGGKDGEKKRRPHRKTHGKIGFVEMSRAISSKWKQLDEATRSKFLDKAKALKANHEKEMAAWKIATQRLQQREQELAPEQHKQEQPQKQVVQPITTHQTIEDKDERPSVDQLDFGHSASKFGVQERDPHGTKNIKEARVEHHQEQSIPILVEKPKRPLTAYNIFFQHERRIMLGPAPIEGAENSNVPPDGKVVLRKVQGKEEFVEMVRAISAKWKSMDKITRSRFNAMAEEQKVRYEKEMVVWKRQCEEMERLNQQMVEKDKEEQPPRQHQPESAEKQLHEHPEPNTLQPGQAVATAAAISLADDAAANHSGADAAAVEDEPLMSNASKSAAAAAAAAAAYETFKTSADRAAAAAAGAAAYKKIHTDAPAGVAAAAGAAAASAITSNNAQVPHSQENEGSKFQMLNMEPWMAVGLMNQDRLFLNASAQRVSSLVRNNNDPFPHSSSAARINDLEHSDLYSLYMASKMGAVTNPFGSSSLLSRPSASSHAALDSSAYTSALASLESNNRRHLDAALDSSAYVSALASLEDSRRRQLEAQRQKHFKNNTTQFLWKK